MARTETILRVFVASPGDVSEERTALESVVHDLSMETSRTYGIRLDLVRWETHAYPGMGSDAQDVINSQINDEYDIFVGILWTRFGTATGRANSGTEEEFNRAYKRHQDNPNSIRIMFYFKDEPVAPSKLNLEQLAKVAAFKDKLGTLGALYWQYTGKPDFEKYLRAHLGQQVAHWGKSWGEGAIPPAPPPVPTGAESPNDEYGYIELVEATNENMAEANQSALRIAEAMSVLTTKISKVSKDAGKLANAPATPANREKIKSVAERGATLINDFVARLETETPIFSNRITDMLEAYAQTATVALDFPGGSAVKQKVLNDLDELMPIIENTHQSMKTFRDSFVGLPRLSTSIAKARTRVLSAMSAFEGELIRMGTLSAELRRTLSPPSST